MLILFSQFSFYRLYWIGDSKEIYTFHLAHLHRGSKNWLRGRPRLTDRRLERSSVTSRFKYHLVTFLFPSYLASLVVCFFCISLVPLKCNQTGSPSFVFASLSREHCWNFVSIHLMSINLAATRRSNRVDLLLSISKSYHYLIR